MPATHGHIRATPGDTQRPFRATLAGPYAYLVSALLAFLGVRQFLAGGARWSNVSLGIGLALLVSTFLVWATAGKSFSLIGMLELTLVRAVPIALGGLAGVLCERVGVVNIGIEGMLLAGAFAGAVVGSLVGGILAAIAVGGLLGLILAALVVSHRVDQIVAGVAINVFVLGLTSYVSSQVPAEHRYLNDAPVFRPIAIPWLSELPLIGPVLRSWRSCRHRFPRSSLQWRPISRRSWWSPA